MFWRRWAASHSASFYLFRIKYQWSWKEIRVGGGHRTKQLKLIYWSTAGTSKGPSNTFPMLPLCSDLQPRTNMMRQSYSWKREKKENFQRLPGQEGGKGKLGHEFNSFWFTLASRKHTLVERAPLRENRLAFSPLFLFSSHRRGLELPHMSLWKSS